MSDNVNVINEAMAIFRRFRVVAISFVIIASCLVWRIMQVSDQNDLVDSRKFRFNVPSITKTPDERGKLACSSPKLRQNFVFINMMEETIRIASSILERFGYRNVLRLAIVDSGEIEIADSKGVKKGNITDENKESVTGDARVKIKARKRDSVVKSFSREMVRNYQKNDNNILIQHVRYNRTEMNAVIPKATYITSLENPVKYFESVFAYGMVQVRVKEVRFAEVNPIEQFMESPEKYLSENKIPKKEHLRSGQSFMLGIDQAVQSEISTGKLIQQLMEEFDLVLIADYMDESLLLLRNQLCLSWNDIIYIPTKFRTEEQKFNISSEVRRKIQEWNWLDMKLYQRFNETFWQKVKDYGPTFNKDLKYFKTLLKDTLEKCTPGDVTKKKDLFQHKTYTLRNDTSKFCKDLML